MSSVDTVARVHQTLFGAVGRAKREHRLTDLLALTLEAHLGFANMLLHESGLPEAADVEVESEVRTQRGRPVDLELIALDGHGGRVARLWSENKTGARYQPDQLADYATDLPTSPSARQLITIVDHPNEVPDDPDSPEKARWEAFTWRDIAVMAWEAGRTAALKEEDRPVWRQAAMRRDAPASQRILVELLSYLEEEHGVVLDPLGYEHVAAFAYAADTAGILDELVRRASELMHLERSKSVAWSNDGDALWQLFDATGTWAAGLGGYPELQAADDDRWSSDRVGEPAFGVGYSMPHTLRDQLLSTDLRPWRDALEGDQFAIADDSGHIRIWRTKYLVELIPKGVTHESQAKELARWADDALAALPRHDPSAMLASR